MAEESLTRARPVASDLEDLRDLWRDPTVASALGGVRSAEECLQSLERWQESWRRFDLGPWIFRRERPNAFVGYCGLLLTQPEDLAEAQLLYAVRPEYSGRGLCTRMGREALEHARERFPHLRVVGYVRPANLASRRVLEKLEFDRVGEIERAGFPHLLYRWTR